MANPTELFIPINLPVLLPNGKMDPTWWNFFLSFAQGISTIDLATQVSGVLASHHGGTGLNNGTRTLTLGGFSLALTQTGNSALTMPTSGTVISTLAFKSKRVTTGAISGGSSGLVVVTWDTAFADANYTPVVSVLDSTASTSSLSITHIEAKIAASITVRVANAAGGPLTGTLQALALHD